MVLISSNSEISTINYNPQQYWSIL